MPAALLEATNQATRGAVAISTLDSATELGFGIQLSGDMLRAMKGSGDKVDLMILPGTSAYKATIRLVDADPNITHQMRFRVGGAYNTTLQFTGSTIDWSTFDATDTLAFYAACGASTRWYAIAKEDIFGVRTLLGVTSGAGATLNSVTGVQTVWAPTTADDFNGLSDTNLLAACGFIAEHRRVIHAGTLPTEPTDADEVFALFDETTARVLLYNHDEESGSVIADAENSYDLTMGSTTAGHVLHRGRNQREEFDSYWDPDPPSPGVPSGTAPDNFEAVNGARIDGSGFMELTYDGNTPTGSGTWPIGAVISDLVNIYDDEIRAVLWIAPVSSDMWTTNLAELTFNCRELTDAETAESPEDNNLQLKAAFEAGWGEVRVTGFNKLNAVTGTPTATAIVPHSTTNRYIVVSIIGDGTGGVIGRFRPENGQDWVEVWNRTGGVQADMETMDNRWQSKTPSGVTAFTGSERTAISRYNQIGTISGLEVDFTKLLASSFGGQETVGLDSSFNINQPSIPQSPALVAPTVHQNRQRRFRRRKTRR